MNKKTHSIDARTRILKAADELFYTQGYQKTGVNQLIEEAEVAKASFYSNFSSKKKLLKEYLKQRHTDWFSNLHQVIGKYEDPKKKIFGLFEYLEQWIKKSNYRGCAFININTELPDDNCEISSIVQTHKQDLRDLIEELTKDIEQKDRSKEHTDLISDTIYIMFEGAIVESQNFRSIWPVKRSIKTVEHLI